MTRIRPVLAGCLLLLAAASCDADKNPAGSNQAASTEAVAAACAAETAYDKKCDKLGGHDPAAVTASCTARPDAKLVREDALDVFTTCVTALDCARSVETCLAATLDNLGIKPDQDPLFKDCQAKASACKTFIDDVCGDALIYTTDAQGQLAACLAKPCADAGVCVHALLGT